MKTADRLYYVDYLRVVITMLVIAHHVGQAYGPTGGWWPIMEESRAAGLGPFFTVNRSFFMSLFFMLAGYFTVIAFQSKGANAFLKERALRLGIPVLIFGLFMIPMQMFVFAPEGERGTLPYIDVGHLWFLEHLLLFSIVYALWQSYRKQGVEKTSTAQLTIPRTGIILLAMAILAAVTGAVRIWYPIDRVEYLLGFFRVAFADVPRDLGFFIIGVLACNHQWLERFPTRDGYRWLAVGVILTIFWYIYDLALAELSPAMVRTEDAWYLVWEILLCFGMCIGLTVLFREKFNFKNGFWIALSKAQYGAYIFHIVFVLAIQFLLLDVAIQPFIKFVVVSLASIAVTFAFSYWVRKPLKLG